MSGAIEQGLSYKIANMGFVGACLVVLLHVSQKLKPAGIGGEIVSCFVCQGIAECAVPFFFIASGFFLAGHMSENGWWGRECKKRVRTLFIPYFFWNILYWGFVHGLKIMLALVGVEFAADLGWGLNLGFNPVVVPQHSHLWFVRALMLAVAISPMFLPLRKKKLGIFYLLAFVLMCECVKAWLIDGVQDWKRAFAISSWFRGLSFFAIGVYLRHNPIAIGLFMAYQMGAVLCLALAFLPWVFRAILFAHGFEMLAQNFELPILLMSVYFLFEATPDSQWPTWLTSCAFPIYLIHGAVLVLFAAICRAFELKDYLSHCSLVFYVHYWALAVGVSIVATLLLRKVRWLSVIAYGGR